MPETILLIDDEEDVSDLVRYHLKKSKFRVVEARDGEEGLRAAFDDRPDAIILDVMMPRLSGFEVARQLKADPVTSGIPILFLSAKGEAESRIKGLELGADDYLPKPFSPKELVLRIKALLRRSQIAGGDDQTVAGPFTVDRNSLKVLVDGRRLDLTSTEFKLLSLLIGKTGQVSHILAR